AASHKGVDLAANGRDLLLGADGRDRQDHIIARPADVADGEAERPGPDGRPLRQVGEGAARRVTAPVVNDLELIAELRLEAAYEAHLHGAGGVDFAVADARAVRRAGGGAADLLVQRTGAGLCIARGLRRRIWRGPGIVRAGVGNTADHWAANRSS